MKKWNPNWSWSGFTLFVGVTIFITILVSFERYIESESLIYELIHDFLMYIYMGIPSVALFWVISGFLNQFNEYKTGVKKFFANLGITVLIIFGFIGVTINFLFGKWVTNYLLFLIFRE